jgi:hypothetical protein
MSLYERTTEVYKNGHNEIVVKMNRPPYAYTEYRFEKRKDGIHFVGCTKSNAKRTKFPNPRSLPKWVWRDLANYCS